MSKRIIIKSGDIFEVKINNVYFYAVVVHNKMAIMEKFYREPYTGCWETLSNQTVRFLLSVSTKPNYEFPWKRVARIKVPHLEKRYSTVKTFRCDTLSKKLYIDTSRPDSYHQRRATPDECRGLERTSVYRYHNVEDRLKAILLSGIDPKISYNNRDIDMAEKLHHSDNITL